MSYPNVRDDLAFDGEQEHLTNEAGEIIWCDTAACDAMAVACVPVSVNKPHDDSRCFCDACYSAYVIGVQHGRHHEAAIDGKQPSRGDYLTPPA